MKTFSFLLLALFIGAAIAQDSQNKCIKDGTCLKDPNTPKAITPGKKNVPVLKVKASGHQIYSCEFLDEDKEEWGWVWYGPNVFMFDSDTNLEIGSHGLGNSDNTENFYFDDSAYTWEANVTATYNSGRQHLDWMLYETVSTTGTSPSELGDFTYAQAYDIVGGVEPFEECTEEKASFGQGSRQVSVFTATYMFWVAPASTLAISFVVATAAIVALLF